MNIEIHKMQQFLVLQGFAMTKENDQEVWLNQKMNTVFAYKAGTKSFSYDAEFEEKYLQSIGIDKAFRYHFSRLYNTTVTAA